MTKISVNIKILGYMQVTIDSDEINDNDISEAIIFVDIGNDDKLRVYYRVLKNFLIRGCKVYLVGVEQSKLFKPLAALMVNYNNYNIYTVTSKDVITSDYVKRLGEREPDYLEIQNFIGGDIVAYADLMTLLLGIESNVEDGDVEGLTKFIESNMPAIESLSTTLDYMKKIVDQSNSQELLDMADELREQLREAKEEAAQSTSELADAKSREAKYISKVEALQTELTKVSNDNVSLKDQAFNGSGIIRAYSETKTQLLRCTTQMIWYIKELTYVPYMNSLLENFCNHLRDSLHISFKLLIYDNTTEMYDIYKPLNIIRGRDYSSMKNTLVNQTDKFVIAEPNKSIIEDVLQSPKKFNLVIVYDRMKGLRNIVSGNNVVKTYVVNSNHEYKELQQKLGITASDLVITRKEVQLPEGTKVIDIPYIEGYSEGTDSARIRKYLKLVSEQQKLPVFNTLLDYVRIAK